jgi:hypothetical protein
MVHDDKAKLDGAHSKKDSGGISEMDLNFNVPLSFHNEDKNTEGNLIGQLDLLRKYL